MDNTISTSIVIPVYNQAPYLEQCLAAVRQSDFKTYELIVVDDGSTDETPSIATKYADKVIRHSQNLGRVQARLSGFNNARGQIYINVDSDVLVKVDTISQIMHYFFEHKDVAAITGLLSKEHPNKNYFSQYKNLYMNYIFSKLSDRVNFLYGSIFACRADIASLYKLDASPIVDDTYFGQRLHMQGKQIAFLKDLQVVHMKKYSFRSLMKNDFLIPYYWALLFLENKGWHELARPKTGFAHASRSQILSVILAPLIIFLILLSVFSLKIIPITILLGVIWLILNARFIYFLTLERGPLFGFYSILFTFLDNVCMALGIFCGFIRYFLKTSNLSK